MKVKLFYIISIFAVCLSCKNENSEKELQLKESEKELSTKENKNSKNTNETKLISKLNQSPNIENVIGNWFIPHNATVNIKFNRDGRFVFNDYNSQTEQEEILMGGFKLEKGVVTLLYDDRAKQKFKITKGVNGDTNYYITKGEDYYFVKGEN